MADSAESKEPATSESPNSEDLKDLDIKCGSSSDTSLQQICRFLDKSDREEQFDYKMLIKAFKYLQNFSLTPTVVNLLDSGVVDMVSRTYDKLVQLDYSKQDVLSSILELLYLVEDLCESAEGKAQCGKYFVGRLLTLATTKVLSVNLHRAAVETLCGIITKSAANQQRVIEDRTACIKMFRHVLPSCGDFQLQACLTEVYYRLLKQEPKLLDLTKEKRVRGAVEALLQQQRPDLLAEIKKIVFLLNETMGPYRSVYTFLANEILLNGHNMATNGEKLINFGKAHLSFYQSDSNSDGPTILDVHYVDILEINVRSTSVLEMMVQDTANVFPAQAESVNQLKNVRIQISMTPGDFSLFETHVLNRLRAQTCQAKTKEERSSGGVRKSSMGILIPLPKEQISALKSSKEKDRRRYLPASLGEIQQSPLVACANANVHRDGMTSIGNGQCNKPDDVPTRKKENFSEDPVIVKATPQRDLLSHPLTSSSKDPPNTQMRSRPTELGRGPDAGKEASGKTAGDVQTRVSLAHIVRCQNQCNNPQLGELSKRDENSDFVDKSMNRRPEEGSNIKLNAGKLQANTTANAMDGGLTVEKFRTQVSGKDNKGCKLQGLEPGVQYIFPGGKVQQQPAGVANIGNTKVVKGPLVAHGGQNMGYKSPTSCNEVIHNGGIQVPVRQSTISSSDKPDAFAFEIESAVEGVKQTTQTSGKKIRKDAEQALPVDDPSNKKVSESTKEKPVKDPPTHHPTRRTKSLVKRKSQKSEYQSSSSKSESELSETLDNDEEWAPDKDNSDPIETASDERRPGAAKGRGQRKGRQILSSNTGKKGNLPVRLRAEKPTIPKGRVQTTSKVNGAQKRKTTHTDVYSFTSEEEERTQFKTGIVPAREKNRTSKRLCRKDRARPASSKRIQEQSDKASDKAHLISRAFEGITQSPSGSLGAVSEENKSVRSRDFQPADSSGHNEKQRVQKDDRKERETDDKDVLLVSMPVGRGPKTDKVDKRSRMERWTTSTYTKASTMPETSSNPAETNDVSSATSAQGMSPTRELSPTTGSYVNAPDTPGASTEDKGLQVITNLIKDFKERVKSETKRKMTDIVAQTSQLIQHDVAATQQLIQKDVADYVQISKDKFGRLNSKLEGQTKRMRLVYEQFQKDFNEHIQQYEKIVEEIDVTDHELIDVARKRGEGHKELFEKLQASSMRRLAEADEKILSVSKASHSMFGLKTAVEGLMQLDY